MKNAIVLLGILFIFSCSKDEGTPVTENQPPAAFTVTATVDENTVNLEWTEASDPEDNTVTYSVSLDGNQVAENLNTRTYQLTNLDFDSAYQGSVTAADDEGLTTTSNFQFNIAARANSAPEIGALTQPENNSIQNGEVTFEWEPATDAENDAISYDVYVNYNGLLGLGNDFVLLAENLSETNLVFDQSPSQDAMISWYVVAKDAQGLSSTSETFNYRTAEETALFEYAEMPPFEARDNHGLVWFNEKLYLIGGGRSFGGTRFDDVWVSDTGRNWTQLDSGTKFTARLWHSTVVFNNKIWIIGGNSAYSTGNELNDIWSSEDGDTWVQENASAAFAPRYGHRVVVYDNQMWLIGGRNAANDISRTEVWKSADGVNWTLVTDNADFGTGNAFDVAVFQNKIWKIASGNDTVYSSADGLTWTLETDTAAFGSRRQHCVTVFDDKLWLFSGSTPSNGNPIFDLWYSLDGKEWILSNENLGYGVNDTRCVPYTSNILGGGGGIIVVAGNEGASGRGTTNAVKIIVPAKFQN
ncbi:MAG: kelch repeat-containing protein [Bacteroidota bacterium]